MVKTLKGLSFSPVTALFLILLIAGTAAAGNDAPDQVGIKVDSDRDLAESSVEQNQEDKAHEWALSIGLSAGFVPDYVGSDDYSFGYGPNISASWHDLLFLKGKTLGANLIRRDNLKAGAILSWASGRDEDDNDRLAGLGDVDRSIEAGGFVAYRKKPLRFRAELRQDIDAGHEGALLELSAGFPLPFQTPRFIVELGTSWASDDYMESFFGVNAEQSAASGLKIYQADAGIKDISIRMTASHLITSRWRIGTVIEYKRLVSDAADSPVVENKNQFMAGFGISYHMGSKILPEDLQ
jgi:outer membrane scaffolding protein for murein synthesis (MipA/OmpV family)